MCWATEVEDLYKKLKAVENGLYIDRKHFIFKDENHHYHNFTLSYNIVIYFCNTTVSHIL